MKKMTRNILIVLLVFVISGVAWSKSPKKRVFPREGSIVISEFMVSDGCVSEDYKGTVTVSGTIECRSHPKEPILATLNTGGVLEIAEFMGNKGKGWSTGRVPKRTRARGRVPRILIPPSKGGVYSFSYEAKLCKDLDPAQYDITLTAVGKRTRADASETVKLKVGGCTTSDSNIPDVIPMPY